MGDMPQKIDSKYKGDFSIIILNLNNLINTFNKIISQAKLMSAGDLRVEFVKRSERDDFRQSLDE